MKYKGVIITIEKVEIPGTSLRELKNGTMKEAKPKFEKFYLFQGSYCYSSMAECKKGIDRIIEQLGSDFDEEIFTKIMNED